MTDMFKVEISRKEFLTLPMKTRRRILELQANARVSTPTEGMELTDEEIKNSFRLNGDESYLRYCAELGIDLQDGINIARFGANKQLLKCHQSEAAIRADERKKIGEELKVMLLDNAIKNSISRVRAITDYVADNLLTGQSPKEG